MHLKSVVISSGTVYASDTTAITGATGTFNCSGGAAYHIHFEVLSTFSDLATRVTVNPANYVSVSISDRFTVYKNWATSGSNPFRTISIHAIDYNLGSADPLNYVKIYYRQSGTTSWSSADMTETSTNSGIYTYSMYVGYSGTPYQVLIAGRRTTSEYWATYPALKTGADIGNSSTPNISSYSDWTVKTVY